MTNTDKSRVVGVVLAGGNSRRMGKDKSMLLWKGRSWLENQVMLLQSVCDEVFISCQKEQVDQYQQYAPCIIDHYLVGPLGGILTSMQKTNATLLVIPNDMLALSKVDLMPLLSINKIKNEGTFYIHEKIKDIAPFPGLYDANALGKIKTAVGTNHLRVRSLLLSLEATLIQPPNIDHISNWNFEEDVEG